MTTSSSWLSMALGVLMVVSVTVSCVASQSCHTVHFKTVAFFLIADEIHFKTVGYTSFSPLLFSACRLV